MRFQKTNRKVIAHDSRLCFTSLTTVKVMTLLISTFYITCTVDPVPRGFVCVCLVWGLFLFLTALIHVGFLVFYTNRSTNQTQLHKEQKGHHEKTFCNKYRTLSRNGSIKLIYLKLFSLLYSIKRKLTPEWKSSDLFWDTSALGSLDELWVPNYTFTSSTSLDLRFNPTTSMSRSLMGH